MNGRKCKLIRRNAEFNMNIIPTKYVYKVVKRVNTGTKEIPIIQERLQIRLGECTRRLYQALKKGYKNREVRV